MKRIRALFLALVIAIGALGGTAAWADRGHHRPYVPAPRHHHHHGSGLGWGAAAGLLIGSAALWAATRPEPVVTYEPVMVPAPVYAPPAVSMPPADGWWYYCRPAGAYYPYVAQCPVPWQRVSPRSGW